MNAHLVQGAEPTLREREVHRLVDSLLDGADRAFALEDHVVTAGRGGGDPEESGDGGVDTPVFAAIANALASPPFMTPVRVVVVHDIGNLRTDQAQWLAGWIAEPLEGVHLVLVAGGGRTPPSIEKACGAHGDVVKPAAEDTGTVLDSELRAVHLRLSRDARERVIAHLGEDAGRVPELVELWHSAYGDGAELTLGEVAPYLGELGTAGRFDLTNAIEQGDVARALEVLHRLLGSSSGRDPKPAHPMQILAGLWGSYRRLLRLDDPSINTPEQAAVVLGMKNPRGARFPLDAARALGTDGLAEAVRLLAAAELDLRGATALDDRTVMEVLVARLAALRRRTVRSRR